jgi:Acyl-CoA carboxylase epsilon subunit
VAQNAQEQTGRPHLRLVRGEASAEEIAALVAVLAARAAAAPPPRRRVSPWADPALAVRRGIEPGPDAWRRSGFTPGVRTRADW